MNPRFSSTSALFRALAALAAVTLGGIGSARAQTTLVGNSPFAPSGMGSSASGAAPQELELAGSSEEGSAVTICVYERRTKHSQWIPVGGVSDGIKVVSYDGAHDRAIVMVSGVRKEISLRKATFGAPLGGGRQPAAVAVAQPAAPEPIGAPASPAAAGTAEHEQREARMLVSDLLEIGVQQRKAYQDAKQKSAAGTTPAQSN